MKSTIIQVTLYQDITALPAAFDKEVQKEMERMNCRKLLDYSLVGKIESVLGNTYAFLVTFEE